MIFSACTYTLNTRSKQTKIKSLLVPNFHALTTMKAFAQSILKQDLVSAVPVHGGDINTCYRLHTTAGVYFLKLNDAAKFPRMFAKEAAGLNALRNKGKIATPQILQHGHWQQQQFLLLQWIESAAPPKNFWQSFGHALANMHKQSAEYFGWEDDNYIGSLIQTNAKKNNWHHFFVECRVLPMLQRLADAGKFTLQEYKNATECCNRLSAVFPDEPPALLHGDLWSGNFMCGPGGHAIVYDPAVYYGHREMDIGMTKLFGGFHTDFYGAYQEIYPLEAGWERRLPLLQLYPVLVHAVLFGGSYVGRAKEIMKRGRFWCKLEQKLDSIHLKSKIQFDTALKKDTDSALTNIEEQLNHVN